MLKKLSRCTIIFEVFFLLQMLLDFDEIWLIFKPLIQYYVWRIFQGRALDTCGNVL